MFFAICSWKSSPVVCFAVRAVHPVALLGHDLGKPRAEKEGVGEGDEGYTKVLFDTLQIDCKMQRCIRSSE